MKKTIHFGYPYFWKHPFPLAQSPAEVPGCCFLTAAPPKHRRHGQRTRELNFVDGSDVILNSEGATKNLQQTSFKHLEVDFDEFFDFSKKNKNPYLG